MTTSDKLGAGDWFFGKILHMGANWQTTLSGIGAAIGFGITTLAGLSYELGGVAEFFPPALKAKIVGFGVVMTVALKIWNSMAQKSKNVTGGNTQQTLDGELAKPGSQTLVDTTAAAPPA